MDTSPLPLRSELGYSRRMESSDGGKLCQSTRIDFELIDDLSTVMSLGLSSTHFSVFNPQDQPYD